MNLPQTLSSVLVAAAVLVSRSAVADEPPPAAAQTAAQPQALPPGHPPAGHLSPGQSPRTGSPHAPEAPTFASLLRGDPFASPQHRLQAERVRSGQLRLPQNMNEPLAGVPPGTIAVLLRDAQNRPLAGSTVTLHVVREDIADGNTTSEVTTTTDAEGRAAFTGQNTETSYRYQVVYQEGSARYASGDFRLRREQGQIVALHVYPTTSDLNQAFVFSRALYVIAPREDVFQVQILLRLHNGSPVTWTASDFRVPLPPGAKAFRPQQTGELRARHHDGSVEISGTVDPGQHELSFSFHLPNPGEANVDLTLPRFPHLVDARVFAESSPTMGLMVPGFRAPEPTQGTDGQPALMASQDFLQAGRPPDVLRTRITGLPTRSNAPYVATALAALVALLGVSFAVSRPTSSTESISDEDRERAKQLLLDELARLERAFQAKEIGPKTYEQARRTLLDSLARLQVTSAAA